MGTFKMRGQDSGAAYLVAAETQKEAKAAIEALYGETSTLDNSITYIDSGNIAIEEDDYIKSSKYTQIISGKKTGTDTPVKTFAYYQEKAKSNDSTNKKNVKESTKKDNNKSSEKLDSSIKKLFGYNDEEYKKIENVYNMYKKRYDRIKQLLPCTKYGTVEDVLKKFDNKANTSYVEYKISNDRLYFDGPDQFANNEINEVLKLLTIEIKKYKAELNLYKNFANTIPELIEKIEKKKTKVENQIEKLKDAKSKLNDMEVSTTKFDLKEVKSDLKDTILKMKKLRGSLTNFKNKLTTLHNGMKRMIPSDKTYHNGVSGKF